MECFDDLIPCVPMSYPQLRTSLHALRRAFPAICLHSIGTTHYGRALLALQLGRGPRTVLIHGAHHANEWITSALLLGFVRDFCRAAQDGAPLLGVDVRCLCRELSVWLVPMVNPDGVDLVTGVIAPQTSACCRAVQLGRGDADFPAGWKANLCGVDLNLNYPAGWAEACRNKAQLGITGPAGRDFAGFSPLSERETVAMAALTARLRPCLTLSYHTQGREIYWQYEDFAPPGARELGEELARVSGYRLAQPPPTSACAGYKDWFLKVYRRPAYTIEAGLGRNPLPLQQLPQLLQENEPLLLCALQAVASR